MDSLVHTPVLAITGPTASGKTRRAVDVARALDGEIISADSRQVYRGMDIGTGKDLGEYGEVSLHLVDIVPAGYKYNLYEYVRDCRAAISDVSGRGRLPVVCGGTGLYLESVLKGLSLPEVPEDRELRNSLRDKTLEELTDMLASMKQLHNVTDVDTCQRAIRAIEIQTYYQQHPEASASVRPRPLKNVVIVGVDIPRDARRARIEARLKARLEEGMIEEVSGLLEKGISPDDLEYYGLEYKFLTQYLTGRISRREMEEGLLIAIRQFAKRQMTWFRGMERRGFTINWLPWDLGKEEFVERVRELLPPSFLL